VAGPAGACESPAGSRPVRQVPDRGAPSYVDRRADRFGRSPFARRRSTHSSRGASSVRNESGAW
jgi:hypothetical protein